MGSGQTLSSSGTFYIVDFSTSDYDTDSAVTTGSSWKFTAPATGFYSVKIGVYFTANGTGHRQCDLYKNGSSVVTLDNRLTVGAGGDTFVNGSTDISLNANDYIDVRCRQTSGGSLNLAGGNHISISLIH